MDAGTLALVACVAAKRSCPAEARDLYVSTWFRFARAHVEARYARWAILSAKHGLLDPRARVAPYERTLNAMPRAERRAWGDRVAREVLSAGPDRVVIFAGARYREDVLPQLERAGVVVDAPLAGLAIGKQLAWLKLHAC
jgi:hypothetical protein